MTQPGTTPDAGSRELWLRVLERTRSARVCGALESIATRSHVIPDGGIDFSVREFSQPDRRPAAGTARDPFAPWEPELFVADLSASHVCLLNKYEVIPHHILIVTRAYEEQTRLLGLADFEALWLGLAAIDGLAFYNAGARAGASQRHKHLQIVPLPLASGRDPVPIDGRLRGAGRLPFVHARVACEELCAAPPAEAAVRSLELYHAMLARVAPGEAEPAYNLLVTRRWMLLVPRRRQTFESIDVNGLGFAGVLLVRDPKQLARLRELGPLRVLCEVGREEI